MDTDLPWGRYRRYGWRAVASAAVVLALAAGGWATARQEPEGPLVALVDVERPLDELGLPVYAHLVDARGAEVAIVEAPVAALEARGLVYRVLDTEPGERSYVLASERTPGARGRVLARHEPLHDDGRHLLFRGGQETALELQQLGMATWPLPAQPLVLRAPLPRPAAAPASYDPLVAAMVAQVNEAAVLAYCRQLSGAEPAVIGGANYTITRRQTNSGVPIEKATQFAAEHLERQGLAASYHLWSRNGYSGRNVVADVPGGERASELVLVVAHLDDVPMSGSAPGADDNASGSVAVMLAAEIMRRYTFERTVRFVFFTGEEQGLYGSAAYAQTLADAGANVVAVVNLDMIAYENLGAPVVSLHTRPSWNPGHAADREIAQTFVDVVGLYGLGAALAPVVVADGMPWSDHSSFWNRGYAALLAIEDDNDFNPYYHTTADTVDKLDAAYFTAFVKASVATAAHLAVPTGELCEGPEAPVLTVPELGSSLTPYPVSWTATSSDGSYELQEDRSADFVAPASVRLDATAVTVIRAARDTATFHYRVRALERCQDTTMTSGWSPVAAITVTGGGECALVVADRTVTGTELFQSCGVVTVGPAVAVASGGAATFRGATAVVVRNGLAVSSGATLAVGTDPSLAGP